MAQAANQQIMDQLASRLRTGGAQGGAALAAELVSATDAVVNEAVTAYMRQTDKLADLQEITNANAYLSGAKQLELSALREDTDAANNALYVGVRKTQATDRDTEAAAERARFFHFSAFVFCLCAATWFLARGLAPGLTLGAVALIAAVFVIYEVVRAAQDRMRRPYAWNHFYFGPPPGAAPGASCYDASARQA